MLAVVDRRMVVSYVTFKTSPRPDHAALRYLNFSSPVHYRNFLQMAQLVKV